MAAGTPEQSETLFTNPFELEDILVFDDETLRHLLSSEAFGLTLTQVAHSLHYGPSSVIRRIKHNLPARKRARFNRAIRQSITQAQVEQARVAVLDALFWELTYWKTPELYEALTEGEQIHPGIFRLLAPELRGKTVLDVGAGSGRATFACLRQGASLVYAVEPSPGLRRIFEQKLKAHSQAGRLILCAGRFDAIPLADQSVDVALSCSAFTSAPEQGGEPGLAELRRVTRQGGKIVLVWPRIEDRQWLEQHGFHFVSLPVRRQMHVHFRSLHIALQVARRFYAHKRSVLRYLLTKQRPVVPFALLGMHPPSDYCWLEVDH